MLADPDRRFRQATEAPPRRILHVCPYMHPFAGGPPVVIERLAAGAGSFGWTASVLTTSLMCNDGGRALAGDLGRHLDIEVLPIDRPRVMGHVSGLRAAVDARVREVDIVHVHTLWHPLNGAVRRACERYGKPYVISPHGMLDPYSLSVRAWRKRLYLSLVERRNLTRAARVVFTSAMEKELALPSLPVATLADVVSLGADGPPPGSRKEEAARFLAAHPGGVDGGRILFLARLHPKKGVECLLAAMPFILAGNRGAHLFVAGSGNPDYEAGLRKESARLGISSKVTFAGHLSAEAKWSAFAAADVFVLPSRQENFAIAVVEAMQAGVPVVVSRSVNIAPSVAGGGAGMVVEDPDDPVALSDAIGSLLGDASLRIRAGERARELAAVEYGWQLASERYFALYDRVLAERGFL